MIWGTRAALARAIADPARLAAADARLDDPEYSDGVAAYDLMAIPVPGFSRVFGPYQKLRAALHRHFELDNVNYLEFAYDWRRPVVVNSALLAAEIEERLRSLREQFRTAGVIVIAHSMGGLVAVDYLRNHDSRGDCRRVYTLGTPFRGAVKALDTLVSGPRIGPAPAGALALGNIAEALHRLPAVYELLPAYPMIEDARNSGEVRNGAGAPARRVAELADAIPGLDARRARDSRAFLAGLNSPCERLSLVRPVIGYGQRTAQHAVLHGGGRLAVSRKTRLLPADPEAGGDGTVPAVSASPAVNQDTPPIFRNQTHNGLVHAPDPVNELIRMLGYDLSRLNRLPPALYPGEPAAADRPEIAPGELLPPEGGRVLGLDPADAYLAGEPVTIEGTADGYRAGETLWFRHSAGATADTAEPATTVVQDDGTFTIPLGILERGLYTLSVADGPRVDGPLDVVHVV